MHDKHAAESVKMFLKGEVMLADYSRKQDKTTEKCTVQGMQ